MIEYGESGELPIAVPRDREGTFEPQLLGKYQRRLPGFYEIILALYAKGMTTRDTQALVKDLYGVEISPTLVPEITEDLDGEVKAWQTRRLEAIWPIVFMDGIVVYIRGESGRDWEGRQELLGLWLNETERAKFWLSCLTDLKNRGVNDIFIVCVDGLSGFPDAIQTAFPQASFHPRLASASMTERRDDSLRQRVEKHRVSPAVYCSFGASCDAVHDRQRQQGGGP